MVTLLMIDRLSSQSPRRRMRRILCHETGCQPVTVKKFYVGFQRAEHQDDLPRELAADIMGGFTVEAPPLIQFGEYHYQLLAQSIGRGIYRGEFKRFGHDDLPHAGIPNGREREIELDPDENTIERNYFLFFQDRKLLIWQENRRASSTTMLSRYMSAVFNHTVTFPPLLTPDAHRAFLLGNHRPKVIEFSVARPVNPAMYQGAGESDRILRIIGGLDGMSGTFRISANSMGVKGRLLDAARAIGLGNDLAQSGLASKVRLELEGVDHPIDLLSDRLRVRIEVEMNGRYPDPFGMYAELERARADVAEELHEILG